MIPGEYSGLYLPPRAYFLVERSLDLRLMKLVVTVVHVDFFANRLCLCRQGYIPIAFVANFPGVARFGVELQDIIAGLLASDLLQVCALSIHGSRSDLFFLLQRFLWAHERTRPKSGIGLETC